MFDAFPDNPQTPEANGSRNVYASLTRVLATKQPQRIDQQHYDVPDPERPGQFVERYWQALNVPVLDAQGNVVQIIHAAVDGDGRGAGPGPPAGKPGGRAGGSR